MRCNRLFVVARLPTLRLDTRGYEGSFVFKESNLQSRPALGFINTSTRTLASAIVGPGFVGGPRQRVPASRAQESVAVAKPAQDPWLNQAGFSRFRHGFRGSFSLQLELVM